MFSRVAGVVALASLVSCSGQIGRSTDSGPPAVDPILAVESGARRLSQAELDNTLRDLLGEDSAPAARLLNEDEFRPFDNDYTIQQASEALITSLEALAEEVAERCDRRPGPACSARSVYARERWRRGMLSRVPRFVSEPRTSTGSDRARRRRLHAAPRVRIRRQRSRQ